MSAPRTYVKCEVSPGLFSREREVAVPSTLSAPHRAIVDQGDVKTIGNQDAVRVYLVRQKEDGYLVDLPRETFTSGPRVLVPKDALIWEGVGE